VPDRGLAERRQAEHPCHSGLAARGVVAVHEVPGREERQVLEQRQLESKPAGISRHAARDLVVGKPEDRAVQRVERESERSPGGPARERLAEHGDVRVVPAKEPLVERLEQAPDDCRGGSGSCSFPAQRHTLWSMPEGDALHRAARSLQPLVGERLEVVTPHPRARVTRVAERLDGKRLLHVEAVGKNLLLRFEGGFVLRSHLRMNGRWQLLQRNDGARTGTPWLVLRGAKREAVLWNGPVLELDESHVRTLGPDILADPPDFDGMVAKLREADQASAIGEALLNQRLVAGIGNLWRAEALWRAQISPWRQLSDLSEEELRSALAEAEQLMRRSLDSGLRKRSVYRQVGHPCPRCGTAIKSRGQGDANRIAYWCPECQR